MWFLLTLMRLSGLILCYSRRCSYLLNLDFFLLDLIFFMYLWYFRFVTFSLYRCVTFCLLRFAILYPFRVMTHLVLLRFCLRLWCLLYLRDYYLGNRS